MIDCSNWVVAKREVVMKDGITMSLTWFRPKYYFNASRIINGTVAPKVWGVMQGFDEFQNNVAVGFQKYCEFAIKYKRKPKMKITFY